MAPFPVNAVPLRVPSEYRRWWRLAEQCSGKRHSFDSVRWYVVLVGREGFTFPGDTNHFAGYAMSERGAIIVGAAFAYDSAVIIHEACHVISSPHDHDPAIFRDKCAALVTCTGVCATRK